MVLLYIAVGGAAGAMARYGLGGWVHSWAGVRFPWGTIVVNLLGSLIIGFAVRFLQQSPATPEVRAFITIGLLGSFTTFSTYSYETVAMLRDGAWLRAGLYSLGSLALGIVAVIAGASLAGLALQRG